MLLCACAVHLPRCVVCVRVWLAVLERSSYQRLCRGTYVQDAMRSVEGGVGRRQQPSSGDSTSSTCGGNGEGTVCVEGRN